MSVARGGDEDRLVVAESWGYMCSSEKSPTSHCRGIPQSREHHEMEMELFGDCAERCLWGRLSRLNG